MGKEKHKENGSKTSILKINMHCQCFGCIKKINDWVKEISLSEGVERADLVVEKGEVRVVGRMDPEKLCCLLHEVTKKLVKIETQSTVPEGGIAASQETKNQFGQAPSDSYALGTLESPSRQRNSPSGFRVTPSAPPLPETWSQTVPSERCAYHWSAPSGTLVMCTASGITGTLAMYEL